MAKKKTTDIVTARLAADELRDCDSAINFMDSFLDQTISGAHEAKRRIAKARVSRDRRIAHERGQA